MTSSKLIIVALVYIICFHSVALSQAGGPFGLPQTGQTKCYDVAGVNINCAGTGQDGELKSGIAWPNPRFTDNNNGTITDNLTGLIWIKNTHGFGQMAWTTALRITAELADGGFGLTDGSKPGQWRLPSIVELNSLIDRSLDNLVLPVDSAFTISEINADNFGFWSSTTSLRHTRYGYAKFVGRIGWTFSGQMAESHYVWPVRNSQ